MGCQGWEGGGEVMFGGESVCFLGGFPEDVVLAD